MVGWLDSWVMYWLVVGIVCCCETPDLWCLWIGLDSWVAIGCWRVLKHRSVVGGCCETQVGGW